MFRLKLNIAAFAVLCAFFQSCTGRADTSEARVDDLAATTEFVTGVDAFVLQPSTFELELVSNGKLHALRKARISFPLSETITQLFVKNGQQVESGQLLGSLCEENLGRRLQQAELRYLRASLDMEDILLGRGFTLKDSLRISQQVWQMAGIRSGYSEALLDLQTIRADLARTSITAPFAGVVAGLEVHAHEQVSSGQQLCVLIDNTSFLARFPVMESELSRIETGNLVEITPFSGSEGSWQGSIQSINPRVDEHGRVEVEAIIPNTDGLMEGMNVRVKVKSPVAGQLVVARTAVVYRDNLEVLFKYASGRAEWTYVNVLHQNSSHFSVVANPDRVASLQPGDTVIVSGNMNLAHGSLVKINPR